MSGFFSPKFLVLDSWQTTVANAFQLLKQILFVVEDTFSFGDFDPKVNWNGMTATGVGLLRARYLKIFSFFWFSVEIQATLAAPLANAIIITIPFTAAGSSATTQAGGSVARSGGGAFEAAHFLITGGTTQLLFLRLNSSATFAAGAAGVLCNGFLEVVA